MPQLKKLARLAAALAGLAVCAAPTPARAQDEFASDAAHLVTALKLQPGQTVADIGAGRGQLAAALAREVGPSGRVYATELSEDRLRDLRALADSTRNLSVVEAKPTSTNLPDRCCDALVLRRVYHHFSDPNQMNASLLASLKPGGRLAIIDFPPDSSESVDPADRDIDGHHGVTSATVVRELGQAGFEAVGGEESLGSDRYLVVVRKPEKR
jgi:ubiquinone/menaquinone biosynthesis C-methylase UbiE